MTGEVTPGGALPPVAPAVPRAAPAAPPTWALPATWTAVDIVSDLHLGPETPSTLAAFSAYLQHTRADAVLLLGDIFEVWIGDDTLAEPDSFEAQAAALLQETARHRTVALMVGNRDFLFGPAACAACGLQALADPTVLSAWGQRLLLAHGDAWCLDDTAYQAFRQQVRSPAWQQAFLARPLAERRAIARHLRAESERRKATHGFEGYGDLDTATVLAALDAANATALVHGHTHRPATHALPGGRQRWVLSDWHAEADGAPRRAEVLRWTATGLARLAVDATGALASSPC